MTPGITPIPGTPGPENPASLLGSQPSPAGTGQATGGEQIRGAINEVSDIVGRIEGLAGQFPEAAEPLRQAKMLIMQATQSIVSSQRGPEPAAPRVMG